MQVLTELDPRATVVSIDGALDLISRRSIESIGDCGWRSCSVSVCSHVLRPAFDIFVGRPGGLIHKIVVEQEPGERPASCARAGVLAGVCSGEHRGENLSQG